MGDALHRAGLLRHGAGLVPSRTGMQSVTLEAERILRDLAVRGAIIPPERTEAIGRLLDETLWRVRAEPLTLAQRIAALMARPIVQEASHG